jgi:dethiobiotin synthetase
LPSDLSARPERLVLVAGTGTEVGKTWVSVRLLRALRDADPGRAVAARKPAQSFDPSDDPSGLDAALLGVASGEVPAVVCPPAWSFPVALAPPMAAARLGRRAFTVAELAASIRWDGAAGAAACGLVETAGGVRSPQAADGDVVDLGRLLSPDLVLLVADAGLGTINAVRLSHGALEGVGAPVVVVLNRFDPGDPLHRENRAWLGSTDGYRVSVLPGDEAELCAVALGRG